MMRNLIFFFQIKFNNNKKIEKKRNFLIYIFVQKIKKHKYKNINFCT